MKKRALISGMLCLTLMATTVMPTFATERTADVFEDKNSATVGDFIIPENPKNAIIMGNTGSQEDISVHLPKELHLKEAIEKENGAVEYSGDRRVTLNIQTLNTKENGIPLASAEITTTVENAKAPNRYSFAYDLPVGYKMMKSEDYSVEYGNGTATEKGWVYILNEIAEVVAVIEPAQAESVNGNKINTYYDVQGNTLVQVVEFDNETTFPVKATTTSTRPQNHKIGDYREYCKIDHNVIGAASFVSGTGYSLLTDAAKEKVKKAIAAKLGSKFLPILNLASWTLEGYATINSLRGYSYTNVMLDYELWAYYKHQGGRWVEGRQYKNPSLYLTLVE
ncbi:hypothetical protein AALA24_09095 [Anaerovoracaceae bacterium 42-11]